MNEKPTPPSDGTPLDWAAELQHNQAWLRTVIAARCQEPQAVDEIMQEVSMAVIKQKAPLRDASKVAPWLYQIAVRQSLMYRRKHGRRRNMEQRYLEQVEVQPQHHESRNTLDWLVASERQQLVRSSVERLAPKEAEILLLKYTQDWTYKQIAEHLGISESAVESRLHRARRNLRREILALDVVETK